MPNLSKTSAALKIPSSLELSIIWVENSRVLKAQLLSALALSVGKKEKASLAKIIILNSDSYF